MLVTQSKLAIISILLLMALPGVATPQDHYGAEEPIIGQTLRSYDACIDDLDEFGWVCEEFNHKGWENSHLGEKFWSRGALISYKADLDDDGYPDLMLKVLHVGFCPRGGPVCPILFLFGDEPIAAHPRDHPFIADGIPTIYSRNEKRYLHFLEGSQHEDPLGSINIHDLKWELRNLPERPFIPWPAE